MLCLMSPEKFVPQDHPLRAIKPFVDAALQGLSPLLDEMYAELGRPSIPPERLLQAKLLQAFYTIRSEVLLVEMLHYNLLLRWFLDLNLTDQIWDNSTFTVNQQRLLDHDTARLFFHTVVGQARERGWLSDTHFTVDGTLVGAWASLKSFAPKAAAAAKKTDDDPGNPSVDSKGEQRSHATHQSTTDPEARLYKKAAGQEAKRCSGLPVLMENRPGLGANLSVTSALATETGASCFVDAALQFASIPIVRFSARHGYAPEKIRSELAKAGVLVGHAPRTNNKAAQSDEARYMPQFQASV